MKSYIEVNLRKISQNLKDLNKPFIAVVKSDAYGLNFKKLYNTIKKHNPTYFCFNKYSEYKKYRHILKKDKVLILSSPKTKYDKNVTYCINNIEDAYFVNNLNKKAVVHFNIDTGMNRSGFKNIQEYLYAYEILCKNKHIFIEGIMTHLVSSNKKTVLIQINKFINYLTKNYKMIHITSSVNLDKNYGTHVRIGAYMYKDSIKAYTYFENIIKVDSGEFVGYNKAYKVKKPGFIGVVPLGYNEGMYQKQIKYHDLNLEILDCICMNHSFVFLDEEYDNSYLKLFDTCGKINIDEIHYNLIRFKDLPKIYKENYDISTINEPRNKKSKKTKKRS